LSVTQGALLLAQSDAVHLGDSIVRIAPS